jgi:hypothetical protein
MTSTQASAARIWVEAYFLWVSAGLRASTPDPPGCMFPHERRHAGHPYPIMPRKHAALVVASQRVAEARRLIADQQGLIARLRALKQPTTDAEAMLQTYRSALRHLEDHEDKIKQDLKARMGGTRKPPPTRP